MTIAGGGKQQVVANAAACLAFPVSKQ